MDADRPDLIPSQSDTADRVRRRTRRKDDEPACACATAQPPTRADASVGRARHTDAPAIGLVQAAVWADAFGDVLESEALDACTPQAFATAWRRSLLDPPPGHLLLVARAGEQIVGFAAVGPTEDPDTPPDTAELLVLAVHPQARRTGHGSRLLNAAVDEAARVGYRSMDAWAPVTAECPRAFLTQAGLAPDGARRERVVGSDGRLLLEVRLGAAIWPAPAPAPAPSMTQPPPQPYPILRGGVS